MCTVAAIGVPEAVVPVILGVAFKGAAVLGAAWAITGLMRRASGSARHVVWCVAIGAALMLPALSTLPGWRVLPDWGVPVARTVGPAERLSERATTAVTPTDPTLAPSAIRADGTGMAQAPVSKPLTLASYLAIAWAIGALLALTPPLLGRLLLRKLERRCTVVTDSDWRRALARACDDLGISRPVSLLMSEDRTMPMTWGVGRARVLLPADARMWSAQRRRIVLLHELAHIKRWDCLTHLVAQVARAVYWFNPLAWVAVWRMQVERERACDDLVLRLGERNSDYAEQLLAVTAGLRSAAFGAAAMAMARTSQLEGRVREILDSGRNRRTVTPCHVLGASLLAAVLVVPVAAMKSAGGTEHSSASAALNGAQPDPHPERWGGKPGDPLPEYLKVSSKLRQIDQAIAIYAANHDDRLLADLGAVFQYMGEARDSVGRSLSPADRARVFLSPEDEKAKKVPENPTPEWVNQNTSFTYLGSADLLLSSIPAWGETAIVHGDLNRGYTTNDGVSRIFVVCFVDSHTDAVVKSAAEAKIASSKATFQALKTGALFPDHIQVIWNVEKIMWAIDGYAKAHAGELPPDLGAALAHVPTEPRRLGTPAQRAAIFLSPAARKAAKIPDNPDAHWVNQNSSYVYLGGPGIFMDKIPMRERTVLVHGDLKDGYKVLGQDGREEQVFVISAPYGGTDGVPIEHARAVVDESKKVLSAVKTGGPLPDYYDAMRDVELIARSILAYTKDHDGLLPPDLGATLKYIPTETLPSAAPAEKARVYLSPKTQRSIKVPDDPTPDWVNRNSSYTYLGGPGVPLAKVYEAGLQVIVHGDLNEPYEISIPGGSRGLVPCGHPVGGSAVGYSPGRQLDEQIAEFKKLLESIKGAVPERK